MEQIKLVKLASFKVNSYDDKEKLLSALASNGYFVTAELEKGKYGLGSSGWRVDVYENEQRSEYGERKSIS